MSPELHALRCGKITASRIVDVMMAPDKAGYQNYMAELVCERLTGRQREGYRSALMNRGNELEPIAKANYEALTGLFVDDGGFVNHPVIERAGASPDGLVDGGLIEIKCRNEAAHITTILDGKIKREQVLQIQWQLACTGRAWCDSVSFHPDFPYELQLHVMRVLPDFKMIAEITAAVRNFDEEVEIKLQELRKRMGIK
jgi:hypothetical protein